MSWTTADTGPRAAPAARHLPLAWRVRACSSRWRKAIVDALDGRHEVIDVERLGEVINALSFMAVSVADRAVRRHERTSVAGKSRRMRRSSVSPSSLGAARR